jgi:type II secretory pathway pseudopilin PulG
VRINANRKFSRGVVLLALLLTLGIGSALAMRAIDSWSAARQREDETELLFIGSQFQDALRSYYLKSPGTARRLPATLNQLLLDDRFPNPVRHLRRIYVDPMTGSPEWGLVVESNQIRGVYSLSTRTPKRRTNFLPRFAALESKATYAEWVFVPELPRFATQPGGAAVPPGTPRIGGPGSAGGTGTPGDSGGGWRPGTTPPPRPGGGPR